MTSGRGGRAFPGDEPTVSGNLQQDTGPHSIALESWISCAPFEHLLNMEIIEAREGTATLRMPFLLQFAQGAALMHGGAILSLADTAMVMAIKSALEPHTHFATVHVTADYLKPVRQGIVTATARLAHRSGRKIDAEAEVSDEGGDTVVVATGEFVVARDAKIRNVTFADEDS